jgi:hypothetical protein
LQGKELLSVLPLMFQNPSEAVARPKALVSVRKKLESLESLMVPLPSGKGGGGCVDRG